MAWDLSVLPTQLSSAAPCFAPWSSPRKTRSDWKTAASAATAEYIRGAPVLPDRGSKVADGSVQAKRPTAVKHPSSRSQASVSLVREGGTA